MQNVVMIHSSCLPSLIPHLLQFLPNQMKVTDSQISAAVCVCVCMLVAVVFLCSRQGYSLGLCVYVGSCEC